MIRMLSVPIIFILLACTNSPKVQKETALQELQKDSIVPIELRYKHLNDSVNSLRENWRKELAKGKAIEKIRSKAIQAFVNLVYHQYFSFWEGTPWAFYGTTTIPQKGNIACGYFVTTVLRDMGVKIDRVAMAKTYSEHLIKTMVRPNHIKKYVPFRLANFVEELENGMDAVYLTGLDNHVGFVVVKNHKAYFIHSSVISPGCVVREPAIESPALQMNSYTVVGNITADQVAMDKWIKGI